MTKSFHCCNKQGLLIFKWSLKMDKNTWVVVSNGSRACILKANSNTQLVKKEWLTHPESRLPGRELADGPPSRGFSSIGYSRYAIESQLPPKLHEAHKFAKEICDRLEEMCKDGDLTSLYISGSPAFLGLLRQSMSPRIKKMIRAEIDKDLTQMSTQEIRKHLPFII